MQALRLSAVAVLALVVQSGAQGLVACKSSKPAESVAKETPSSSVAVGAAGLPAIAAIIAAKPQSLLDALMVLAASTKDWERIVLSGSTSLQGGNRMIISSASLATNVGIQLSPNGDGFASLEIKAFDQSAATWRFVEISFAKDLEAASASERARLRDAPFQDGMAVNFEVLTKGENKCEQCHAGHDSRMDMREMPGLIGPGDLVNNASSAARERFAVFTTASSQDSPASPTVKSVWLETSRRFATRFAQLDVQALTKRLSDALSQDPKAAAGVLRILEGCSFSQNFNNQTAQEAIEFARKDARLRTYFANEAATGVQGVGKLYQGTFDHVFKIRDIEAKGRQRAADANGLPVTLVDSEELRYKFAALMVFLDPLTTRTTDLLTVRTWGMTARHTGPWFNPGDEGIYLNAIREAMIRVVNLQTPNCLALSKFMFPGTP